MQVQMDFDLADEWRKMEIELYGKTYDTYLAQTILSGMSERYEDVVLDDQFL